MASKLRKQLRIVLLFLAVFLTVPIAFIVISGLYTFWWPTVGVAVPKEAEVRSMTARVDHPSKEWKGTPEFTVPAHHVSFLLRALQPAGKDYFPAKWVGLGQLNVTDREGNKIRIDLYLTYQSVGAFAVESRGRAYFRGGNDQDIQVALRQAYRDSKVE
jgi:hypothetical protein